MPYHHCLLQGPDRADRLREKDEVGMHRIVALSSTVLVVVGMMATVWGGEQGEKSRPSLTHRWLFVMRGMDNAHGDYYSVNGSWAGSWEGLDPKVGIVNWYGQLQGKNAPFFTDRGHRQILAGYYDGNEHGEDIVQWLKGVEGVRGVAGAMYTTWRDRYDAMDEWAAKAWGER